MTKRFKSHTAQLIKRSCKRFTAAVLVLLLIVMFIPSAIALGNDSPVLPDEDIPETLTRAQLEAHGAVARLRSEESDEFTFVYLNEDGTRTSYSYGVAVKYEENGEYKDKNNTIKDFNSEYGNTASDVELRFPKKLNKISVKYKNHNVKIKPVTDAKVSASVNGNTVTYYGAFGLGMDLRYASTMSGMKEDIILQSYQGVNSFSFEVDTDGLELKQINGQYVIADGETAIFSFGDLEVTDSFTGEDEATDNWDEHMTYAQGAIQTVKANKEYIFTITVDEEFLTADTTVYPVNIDPTFTITSNYIQDTYICEGSPAANFGSTAQMKIGYGASTKRNRILVNFSSFVGDQSRPGLHHTTINSAYYNMYCTTTYTSKPYVDAYMVALNATQWTDTGATWNNAYSSTSTNAVLSGSSTVGTAGWYTFDITSAYTTWWQAFQYKGLMFRMRNEGSSPNYYRHFSSVNVANSAQLPYLAVNYGTTGGFINITKSHGYMEIGDRLSLEYDKNIKEAEIVWSSSDTSVAVVSGGVIDAVGAGYATITARSAHDPNAVDTYELQVITVPVTGVELNYTTAYVAKGKTLTATATVLPSNASYKAVTWSSSNESVAEVNATTGVITAKASGTATITATTVQGNKTDTMTVIVPEFEDGEYYLKNKDTGRYADIEGPTNDSGAIIHQWDYHGYASQQWEFTLLPDGYYKIKSMHSNLYLTVQNNSSADNTAIIQTAYTGATGQQWKVELLANGHYKITAKCGESSGEQEDYVLASEYYLINGNGFDVKQRLYVGDTNYKDEWDLYYKGRNKICLEIIYDQAYINRYPDYNNRLSAQLTALQEKYLSEFEIWIEYSTPTSFYSYADTYCSTSPTHQCQHSDELGCENSAIKNGTVDLKTYHHNNYYNIMYNVPFPDTSESVKLVYSGHDTCAYKEKDGQLIHSLNPYYGLANRSIGLIMVTNNVSVASAIKTTVHEFGHLLRVKDHYKTGETETFSEMYGLNFNNNCIWGMNKDHTDVINNLTMCDGCKAFIENNRNTYNHE